MVSNIFDELDIAALHTEVSKLGRELILRQDDPSWRLIEDNEKLRTVADTIMNKELTALFEQLTPGTEVFSEERSHTIKDRPNCYWLVDPIDGTASWLGGFSGFVIQAAYIKNHTPEFGIICHPHSSTIWHNDVSGNVLQNNKILNKPIIKKNRVTLIDNYPRPYGLAKVYSQLDRPTKYIESGSLGLKAIQTLIGNADLFVKSTIFRDWDMAPAIAITRKTSGKITDGWGKTVALGEQIEFQNGLIVSHDEEISRWAINKNNEYKIF